MLVCIAVLWVLPTLVPLVIGFLWVRKRYITTSREVKRFDAVTRSPIYASFGATLKVGFLASFRLSNPCKPHVTSDQDEYCIPRNKSALIHPLLHLRLLWCNSQGVLFNLAYCSLDKKIHQGIGQDEAVIQIAEAHLCFVIAPPSMPPFSRSMPQIGSVSFWLLKSIKALCHRSPAHLCLRRRIEGSQR